MGCNAWNHPPGCTCGWGGEYHGGDTGPLFPSIQDLNRENARRKLTQLNIRSQASCYVVPNATCPVCKQSVFFYANEFGSRVYFNAPGHPWEKHGCTDLPKVNRELSSRCQAPVLRPMNEVRDILETARVAELGFLSVRVKKAKWRWILHVVTAVRQVGSMITIQAESVSDGRSAKIEFNLISKRKVIHEGDFLSKKMSKNGEIYSFLRRDTLEREVVFDGQSLDAEFEAEDFGFDNSVVPNSLDEMTQSESKHFESQQMHAKKLTEKYTEILSSLSKRNIIGPKLVTHYLNAAGHTTAIGARWTPRLAYFLICRIGAPTERVQNTMSQRASGNSQAHRHGQRKRVHQKLQDHSADELLGIDDLMRKLSRLGRVSRQGD